MTSDGKFFRWLLWMAIIVALGAASLPFVTRNASPGEAARVAVPAAFFAFLLTIVLAIRGQLGSFIRLRLVLRFGGILALIGGVAFAVAAQVQLAERISEDERRAQRLRDSKDELKTATNPRRIKELQELIEIDSPDIYRNSQTRWFRICQLLAGVAAVTGLACFILSLGRRQTVQGGEAS